jgi:hypothetical protein
MDIDDHGSSLEHKIAQYHGSYVGKLSGGEFRQSLNLRALPEAANQTTNRDHSSSDTLSIDSVMLEDTVITDDATNTYTTELPAEYRLDVDDEIGNLGDEVLYRLGPDLWMARNLKQENGNTRAHMQTAENGQNATDLEYSENRTTGSGPESLCALCSEPGNLCTECQGIRYCSSKCREEDRPTHEALCKTFIQFANQRQPTPKHSRAILFPAKSGRPRWVWLKSKDERTIAAFLNVPSTKDTTDPDKTMTFQNICRNGVLGRDLLDDMRIYYRETSKTDPSPINKSITVATGHLNARRWNGSVLVCATLVNGDFRHMETADYRHVLDALSVVDPQGEALLAFSDAEHPLDPSKIGKVEAVRCDCDGERRANGTAQYRSILLPRLHPQGKWVRSDETLDLWDMYDQEGINRSSVKSRFTTRLEIPIRMWQVDIDCQWSDADSKNPPVPFLYFNTCHIPSKYPPDTAKVRDAIIKAETYRRTPGSVFLARSDGKPLLPEHVEAIAAFARFVVVPRAKFIGKYEDLDCRRPEDIVGNIIVANTLDTMYGVLPGAELSRPDAWSWIQPARFKTFWGVFQDLQGWEHVPSPYEV